jgi:aminocarboxymuconate-semialdehyde decarboxylase
VVVDIHTHFVPEVFPAMGDRRGGDRWPQMQQVDARQGQVMISGRNFRTVTDDCWSAERRLEVMEKDGISRQAISPMPELLSYWADAADARDFARYINEGIARLVETEPNRFSGLGMVPLQDPEMAAAELSALRAQGLVGVELGSNIGGRSLGEPRFRPFFVEAAAQGMAIFVHSFHPLGVDRLVGPAILDNYVGFPLEVAFTIASLITGGVLEACPDVRIACSHGGGGFAMLLPRLTHGWQLTDSLRDALPRSPEEYARRLYFDTLVYDARPLRLLLDMFGPERLVVGSDYPFVVREVPPGRALGQLTELPAEDREAIRSKNALRFLGLTSGSD